MEDQKIFFKNVFKNYQNEMFTINVDLSFWGSFLNEAIKNYIELQKVSVEMFSAIFCVYNLDHKTNAGNLFRSEESRSINSEDLYLYRDLFFNWIMNLAVLKAYIAMERALMQIIWIRFFPSFSDPNATKKNEDKLNLNLRNFLKNNDRKSDPKNNRHIISFLRFHNSDFDNFLDKRMGFGFDTSWINFFEVVSILRNTIAHNGSIISVDIHNQIKSVAKDLFERYFYIQKNQRNENYLCSKENEFNNFLSLFNSFTVNTLKFVLGEKDLSCLGLKEITII